MRRKMNVSSAYTSTLVSWAATLPAGSSAARSSASGKAAWGVSDVVSLGRTNATQQAAWQFELSAVYGKARSPTNSIPESQRKAEAKVVAQALALIEGGATEQARAMLGELLASNRTNAEAVHALGQADLAEGKYAEAERQFLRAHALNQSAGYDRDARNARVLQKPDADVLATARAWSRAPTQRDEGIRLLIELTRRNPKLAAANIALGDALLAKGDRSNGLLQYGVALPKAAGDDLDQLETRINQLAARQTGSLFLREMQGKIQLQRGRYAEAVLTLTRVAAESENPALTNRDLARAHLGLGREALSRGDVRDAIAKMEYAQTFDASSSELKLALGEALAARARNHALGGRSSDALADYARAAALLTAPGGAAARARAAEGVHALGVRLQRARELSGGRVSSEVQAFQLAYDLDSSNATYRRRLADARVALGDQYTADGSLKEAAYAYERAYVLNKHDAGYRQKFIAGFTAWGDQAASAHLHDDAVAAYRRAYAADTWNAVVKGKLAESLYARGLEHVSNGKLKLAARDFADAVSLFPDNPTYQAQYELYRAHLQQA